MREFVSPSTSVHNCSDWRSLSNQTASPVQKIDASMKENLHCRLVTTKGVIELHVQAMHELAVHSYYLQCIALQNVHSQ